MDKAILKILAATDALVLIQIKYINGSMYEAFEPRCSFLYPAKHAEALERAFNTYIQGTEWGDQYCIVISSCPDVINDVSAALEKIEDRILALRQ